MSVSAKKAGLEGDVKKVIKLINVDDNEEELDYFLYILFVVAFKSKLCGFFFSFSIIIYITNTYISVCGRYV